MASRQTLKRNKERRKKREKEIGAAKIKTARRPNTFPQKVSKGAPTPAPVERSGAQKEFAAARESLRAKGQTGIGNITKEIFENRAAIAAATPPEARPQVQAEGAQLSPQKQSVLAGTALDPANPLGLSPQSEQPTEGIAPVQDEFRVSDPTGAVFNEAGEQTNIPKIVDLISLGATSTTSLGGFGSLTKALTRSAPKVISKESKQALKEIERWEAFHAGGKEITEEAFHRLEVLRAKAGVVGENTALKELNRFESFFSGGKKMTSKEIKIFDKLEKKALEISQAQQDFIIKTKENLLKSTKTIIKGVDTILKANSQGERLIKTKGLSNSKVAQTATGKFNKLVSERIVETIKLGGGKVKQNVWAAEKTVSWTDKLINSKKFQKALVGVVSTTILNGFLEEEAEQSVSRAADVAGEEGFEDLENELLDYGEELTDKSLWDYLSLIIPLKGVVTYMNAARKNWEVKRARQLRRQSGKLTPEDQKFEDIRIAQAERDARIAAQIEKSRSNTAAPARFR